MFSQRDIAPVTANQTWLYSRFGETARKSSRHLVLFFKSVQNRGTSGRFLTVRLSTGCWVAEPTPCYTGHDFVTLARTEPAPVPPIPNEQQLARLTDYVAFLEN